MGGMANGMFHHGVPKAMVDPRYIKAAKGTTGTEGNGSTGLTAADVPKRISISLRNFEPNVKI